MENLFKLNLGSILITLRLRDLALNIRGYIRMKFKIVESLEKQKYIYSGPIYDRNDSEISPKSEFVTFARSFAEAKRNILYQIKQKIGEGFINDTFLKLAETAKKPAEKIDSNKINVAEQLSMF